LRLALRAGRASGRASFRGLAPRAVEAGFPVAFEPLEWPLRWLQEGAGGFAERGTEVPLEEDAALPLDLAPFPLLEPLPLCFPGAAAGALGLQRFPSAGREPVAGRDPEIRAAAVRASLPERRAGRLPEDD
jgi:hypothetical protein